MERCSYKKEACSAKGRKIKGVWVCDNHLVAYEVEQQRATHPDQSADAQATVEALQAQMSQAEGVIMMREATMEQIREEADASRMQYQQQVEALQRELESANALLHKKNCAIGKAETSIQALQRELLEWKRALCNLTPGGSEFADDHAYCAEWVRKARENQHDIIISKHRELKATQTALDAERERSKKQAEEAMVVFSKLSQLQALVRDAVLKWRAQTNVQEGISFRMSMKSLEATLDATPTEEAT